MWKIVLSAACALCALLAAAPAGAATIAEDFSGPASGYTVTVLDDGGSALTAAAANGRFEINGSVVAGGEPKVILEPTVALRAGDSWSVEATVLMRHDLLPSLATRDSLQAWISIQSSIDGDDDVRAKSGLLKGTFDVGPITVNDGYFVSSGYVLDDDAVTGSGSPTEYAFIDPAAADASATIEVLLRVEYDATLGELTTSYALDGGAPTPYPLEDGGGSPAPTLDPLVDWGLAPDDTLEIFLLFSATQAAGSGPSNPVGSSFSLLSGDVWLDDLVATGTLIATPEPGTGLLVAFGLLGLACRPRGRRRSHPAPRF